MYIEPNTNIKLYNIPLNKDSDDALWFPNYTEQLHYFSEHLVASFPKCTYQRATKGMCRVEGSIASLYNANYMSFQNSSFSGKVFYAWIDNIEYINNITVEIYFTVDPLQSWFFEMDLGECFIERQHSERDYVGENILPESVSAGEYVLNGEFEPITDDLTNYRIAVMYIDENSTDYTFYNGIFGGCVLRIFDTTQAEMTLCANFIHSFQANYDNVVGVYMLPAFCVNYLSGGVDLDFSTFRTIIEVQKAPLIGTEALDGYVPKNKKMYTYPYNFYNLFGADSNLALRYEFFEDLTPCFEITGTNSMPIEVNCFPTGYKKVPTTTPPESKVPYYMERLTLRGYPVCSWVVDYYKAWMAQNSVPMSMRRANEGNREAVNGLVGYGTGNYIQMLQSSVSMSGMVNSDLATSIEVSMHSDIVKGNYQSANDDFSQRRMTFYGGRMSIPNKFARSIDNFFTMFGYTQNKVAVPNLRARSRFTYIKTVDAQIQGDMPVDWADEIASMFNKGIRFWCDRDDSRIGKYPIEANNSLDNNVLNSTPEGGE